jgi:hypothetical protein
VLPAADYAVWEKEASAAASRAFVASEEDAHWGWPWKEP